MKKETEIKWNCRKLNQNSKLYAKLGKNPVFRLNFSFWENSSSNRNEWTAPDSRTNEKVSRLFYHPDHLASDVSSQLVSIDIIPWNCLLSQGDHGHILVKLIHYWIVVTTKSGGQSKSGRGSKGKWIRTTGSLSTIVTNLFPGHRYHSLSNLIHTTEIWYILRKFDN